MLSTIVFCGRRFVGRLIVSPRFGQKISPKRRRKKKKQKKKETCG